jgi:predicted MPP superfamily phosphohydrolase
MAYAVSSILWDAICTLSVIGIWPRFIEPVLLSTSRHRMCIPDLPPSLRGFKILQFSDLHFNPQQSPSYLDKLANQIKALSPDLIAFTGDFLCYSKLEEPDRLKQFLNRLSAPHGCFAVLGNHDYAQSVSINAAGDYDVIEEEPSSLKKVFSRLARSISPTKQVTQRARNTPFNSSLTELLKETPFTLLHNETKQISVGTSKLNLCGFGEHMLGKTLPSSAYAHYDPAYPGILLLHNPDGAPHLKHYPGNIILAGHTHGGQINLPWIWKRFTLMENRSLKRGWHAVDGKQLYINRGIGGVLPFRFFAVPELLLLTLE